MPGNSKSYPGESTHFKLMGKKSFLGMSEQPSEQMFNAELDNSMLNKGQARFAPWFVTLVVTH